MMILRWKEEGFQYDWLRLARNYEWEVSFYAMDTPDGFSASELVAFLMDFLLSEGVWARSSRACCAFASSRSDCV